jgi:xanthine/uracil/vitamin C permease (AzgA family)
MSLNVYFTYSVCLAMHVPWRTALAVVFFSGVLFLVLTLTRVREQIVNGIPGCLKHSTAAGIGMFIAFIGLRNAKLVVAHPATFVGVGSFSDKAVQTACFGLVLTLVQVSRRLHGAILLGSSAPPLWEFSVASRVGPGQSSAYRARRLRCSSLTSAVPATSGCWTSCLPSCL